MKKLQHSPLMKGVKAVLTAAVLAGSASVYAADPIVQDFGTGTGSLVPSGSTQKSDTTIIPKTEGYKTFARVGANIGGLVNIEANNLLGTSGSLCRGVASSSTNNAVTKITPFAGYAGTPVFYTSFKVLFGKEDGTAGAASGTWTFGQGKDTSSSSQFTAGNSVTTQGFVALKFKFTANSTVDIEYKKHKATDNSEYTQTGLSMNSLQQGEIYTIEIVGNNQNSGNVTYKYGGEEKSVAPQKFDLYVNGEAIGSGLDATYNSTRMPKGREINSVTFDGDGSTGNEANIFIDDVKTWTQVPSEINYEQPNLTTEETELSFGSVKLRESKTLSVNLTGVNLTGVNLTVNIENNASVFSAPSSIEIVPGGTVNGTIDVTFNPTNAENYGDTLVISGGGLKTAVKIPLQGSGTDTQNSIGGDALVVLKVFPNPIYNGQLLIDKGQIMKRERVEVYNTQGVLMGVYFVSEDQTPISLNNLPNGLYIVRVSNKIARIYKH